MRIRLAAFAACVVAFVVAWPAIAADAVVPPTILTLDDAFARVADYQGKNIPICVCSTRVPKSWSLSVIVPFFVPRGWRVALSKMRSAPGTRVASRALNSP